MHRSLMLLATLCFSLAPSIALAASPIQLEAQDAGLESTVPRMISYRHQEHMWITSDGAVHLIINEGDLSPSQSLTLFTSLDGGITWTPMVSLPSSNGISTSDGALVEDRLHVTYATDANTIAYATIDWDATAQAWDLSLVETAFESSFFAATNPALVVDDEGSVWCGFVRINRLNFKSGIRMVMRDASTSAWADTRQTFGIVDGSLTQNIERSPRPVQLPNGIGMVYTVHHEFRWAYRDENLALDEAWDDELLRVVSSENLDPYASHFSVSSDDNQNLYLVTVDDGRLLFQRYRAGQQVWESPQVIVGDEVTSILGAVGYPQVTLDADDTVSLVFNLGRQARVFQSDDHGRSFPIRYQLLHSEITDPDASFDFPRMQSPRRVTDGFPVLQQYVVDDGDVEMQRALQFTIPDGD